MAKLKVFDSEFELFEEVIAWAWNVHKIEFDPFDTIPCHELTEEQKQEACQQLEKIIQEDPCHGCDTKTCHGCNLADE